MLIIGNGIDEALDARVFREMFEERKRVFVDLLGWDIPVLAGRYEIDQFDNDEAVYIVVTDAQGHHRGSARLLKTDRPHILGSVFPHLCDGNVPVGPEVREITRFCLARAMGAAERRTVRNRLVSGLVEHALASGITTFSGVAEESWFKQILAFGWDCELLGDRLSGVSRNLAAMRISISSETPDLLRRTGIYPPTTLVDLDRAAA